MVRRVSPQLSAAAVGRRVLLLGRARASEEVRGAVGAARGGLKAPVQRAEGQVYEARCVERAAEADHRLPPEYVLRLGLARLAEADDARGAGLPALVALQQREVVVHLVVVAGAGDGVPDVVAGVGVTAALAANTGVSDDAGGGQRGERNSVGRRASPPGYLHGLHGRVGGVEGGEGLEDLGLQPPRQLVGDCESVGGDEHGGGGRVFLAFKRQVILAIKDPQLRHLLAVIVDKPRRRREADVELAAEDAFVVRLVVCSVEADLGKVAVRMDPVTR
mmetsp:Transcript_39389/g.104577  ORF Transcript_39389/g.104577 Transcript_39389/m.104577 type:complete len:276 (-) Transcript_39389:487-1314(-)